ncbi:hypothetical protein FALBO_4896 [Fusarium albosuccineum]|uniref:Uncharacterized protein n=1 Tax=Fusarium albosuccineum TaxID=1237068 RepID=A0A8H4LEL2_9HYPO|nr:hypothetical protein FALBO_4896 [Fusarium albosuccineum]
MKMREPVPLDVARPCVAQLPDLVVRRILSFLHDLSPSDMPTVACLSSYLYQQARYIQHQDIHVHLDNSKHVLDRLHLIRRLDQLAAVRTLRVSSRKYSDDQRETNVLAHIAEILPEMTGLRHLHWHVAWASPASPADHRGLTAVPIPAPILAALPAGLHLHTAVLCNPTSESHVQARAFLQRLAGNQSLCTLSINITFIEERDCAETMRALKNVLLSCPITSIPDMDVWYSRTGCEGYGPKFGTEAPYPGLGFTDGDRLPVLEELGLRDYPWGIEGAKHCQGYVGKGHEWDRWANMFDWSRLMRLNNLSPSLASAIAPKLTRLKEIVVDNGGYFDPDFLDNVNSPLELLSLSGWNQVNSSPEKIAQFGATLRHLKVHEQDRAWTVKTPALITAPDLVNLGKSLISLEHVALDISRIQDTEAWPYEAFDAIAAFPQLCTVELWFPMDRDPPAMAPSLTISSARHLFHYIRKRNGNIQRLTLHSDAPLPPTPMLFGNVVEEFRQPEPSWARYNNVSFVCEKNYRGEGSKEDEGGYLSVSCPNLSWDKNAELNRLAQHSDRKVVEFTKYTLDELRYRVALDGPLDKEEWVAWRAEYWRRQPKAQQAPKEQSSSMRRFVIGPLKRVLRR